MRLRRRLLAVKLIVQCTVLLGRKRVQVCEHCALVSGGRLEQHPS